MHKGMSGAQKKIRGFISTDILARCLICLEEFADGDEVKT